MRRREFVRNLFGITTVGVLFAAPIELTRRYEAETRNFRVFEDGILYRSGQMKVAGLKRVVQDYGIRTVISLRDAIVPGEPPPDLDEEHYCRINGINHYRLPPRPWWAPAGPPPVEDNVRRFTEIMADPNNYPVLLHCFAGTHRTGAYCAIYRMEHDHWTNADAIAELKQNGYVNLDQEWDVLGYLEEYRPTWMGPPEPQSPGHKHRTRRPPVKPAHPISARSSVRP
jgi:protein tyrosine/serine phosphatase